MRHQEFGSPGDAFGPGPWAGEPGRVDWRHDGMPCLLRRNRMGVWCGYVAVPPGHPLHGAGHDVPGVSVHGGLTYSARCDGAEGIGICHVPGPGESGDVWWFGFDCAHGGDAIPSMPEFGVWASEGQQAAYRDLAYARAETEHLADQLSKARYRSIVS